jgi:hypothetical protein
LTKLLRLRYQIPYRKGKEKKKVVDALSSKVMIGKGLETVNKDVIEDLGNCNSISIIVPTWIRKSWKPTKNNYQLQEIIYGKLEGAKIWPEYSFVDGILSIKKEL